MNKLPLTFKNYGAMDKNRQEIVDCIMTSINNNASFDDVFKFKITNHNINIKFKIKILKRNIKKSLFDEFWWIKHILISSNNNQFACTVVIFDYYTDQWITLVVDFYKYTASTLLEKSFEFNIYENCNNWMVNLLKKHRKLTPEQFCKSCHKNL